MNDPIEFFVPGVPAPGGSKNAFVSKYTGKVLVVDAGKRNKQWRQIVATYARLAMKARGLKPLDGPVMVSMIFYMPRPKAHFNKAGEMKPVAPFWHTQKPDSLKLRRSTEDALTGIVYHDDAQIVIGVDCKYWCQPGAQGATITVQKKLT